MKRKLKLMRSVTAFYRGQPDARKDHEIETICTRYQGEEIGSGYMFPWGKGGNERDVQWAVPADCCGACAAALQRAGFKVQVMDL